MHNTNAMNNNSKYRSRSAGFTLVEIAIGMLIIGLLIAPAISAYNLYQKKQKIDQTEFSLDRASTSLDGYLSAFGRYPCPAAIDVPPGDVRYGFEARDAATGACEFAPAVSGVSLTVNPDPTRPNPNVLIGKLPFKTLNLQENEIFDGYGARLTYAVSEVQTDELSYSPNEGAIGIEKIDDSTGNPISLISVPNSAHYVIVSHGPESQGGYSANGVLIGTCGATLANDQENCNGDAVFRFSEETTTSDDKLAYVGGKTVTPWQYENGNTDNIHLKAGGENVVAGMPGTSLFTDTNAINPRLALRLKNEGREDQISADCTALPFTAVCLDFVDDTIDLGSGLTARDICAANLNAPECSTHFSAPSEESDGILRVQRETNPLDGTEVMNTGAVLTRELCNGNEEAPYGSPASDPDCFNPRIIGGVHNSGALPAGGPMGAPVAGARYGGVTSTEADGAGGNMACPAGEVMVGIHEGQIVCTSTVTLGCPSGQYLTGITPPPPSGPPGSSAGLIRCNTIPDPPCPALSNVNNSCGGTSSLPATAAGTYELAYSGQCHEIAAFNASHADTFTTLAELQDYVDDLNNAIRTSSDCSLVRDRFDCPASNFNTTPGRVHERRRSNQNFRSPTSSSDAETLSHSGYVAYNSSSPMSVHPANNNGNHDCWCREDYRIVTNPCSQGSGNEYTVQKYPCPQTAARWVHEYDTGNRFCTCVPGTGTRNGGSCASRISGSFNSGGVTGNVIDNTAISCPYSVSVTGSSFENCACPARPDQVPDSSPAACPSGTTNSFTFEGVTYNDAASVTHRRWTCPSVSGHLDTAAEVGFWTTTTHTEPCSCNDGEAGYRPESCPANQLGERRIETELDCSLSPPAFVDVVPQNILQNCRSCRWTAPTAGSPSYDTNPVGRPIGSPCNCNTDMSTTTLCRQPNGSGWDVFGGCSCQAQ